MFGLGMGEIVVILIVALLFLGPDKLPDAAKQLGRTLRELRKHTDNLKETIDKDETIGGTVRELRSALRGDSRPSIPRPKTEPAADEQPVAQGAEAPAEAPADATTPMTAAELPGAAVPAPVPATPSAPVVARPASAPAIASASSPGAEPKARVLPPLPSPRPVTSPKDPGPKDG